MAITETYETSVGNGRRGPIVPFETGFDDPDNRIWREKPYEPRGYFRIQTPDGETECCMVEFNPNVDIYEAAEQPSYQAMGHLLISRN